ncbi:hypothetical protein C8R44DRAFT_781185 [Mycena epipterygia]|nr:hypothetical protein C8R44DRAFT_781185 [Mycena epipterygia]
MASTLKAAVPLPSSSSLAFRAHLARLVSPLRRVRPRVPFYELAIHRIPTLTLYRNLLRHAPDDNIRLRVQYLFRKHQHITGTEKTRTQLLKGYKWLDAFKTARQGDENQIEIFRRYSRLIAAKVEKEHMKRLAREEAAWQAKLRSRPIVTGGLLKASLYNRPLPRLKPQPPAISGMIMARMRARVKRYERLERLDEEIQYLRGEAAFEEHGIQLTGESARVYSGDAADGWLSPLLQMKREIMGRLALDHERSITPVSPELQEMLRAARREKIANKTRENLRERRGEITRRMLKRARKGPPAHVLVHMTPSERRIDKVVRGVGEVGYVGMLKRKVGFKLRDGGKGLARENGTDLEGEQLERLKEMEKEYRIEAMRRMKRNSSVDNEQV